MASSTWQTTRQLPNVRQNTKYQMSDKIPMGQPPQPAAACRSPGRGWKRVYICFPRNEQLPAVARARGKSLKFLFLKTNSYQSGSRLTNRVWRGALRSRKSPSARATTSWYGVWRLTSARGTRGRRVRQPRATRLFTARGKAVFRLWLSRIIGEIFGASR